MCSIVASVGAIVIEIRGAMRNDFPDFSLYANACAGTMGLRWAGLMTEGHAPPYTRDPATGGGVFGKWSRRDDYSLARIDAAALISTLELALRGNFTALIQEYARNVTWKDRDHMISWAETKLALPQYTGVAPYCVMQVSVAAKGVLLFGVTLSAVPLPWLSP